MIKRFIPAALLVIAILFGMGCSDHRAEELFDTAQLEERQNSLDHARQLYLEVMDKYPDSPYAQEARKRLEALSGKNSD